MITVLVISMIFMHILDDYVLQGILSKLKQKSFWDNYVYPENVDKDLYKNDYKVALFIHGLSWSIMVHIPVILGIVIIKGIDEVNDWLFLSVLIHAIIHAIIDHQKANRFRINLFTDQIWHARQLAVILACALIFWI